MNLEFKQHQQQQKNLIHNDQQWRQLLTKNINNQNDRKHSSTFDYKLCGCRCTSICIFSNTLINARISDG